MKHIKILLCYFVPQCTITFERPLYNCPWYDIKKHLVVRLLSSTSVEIEVNTLALLPAQLDIGVVISVRV